MSDPYVGEIRMFGGNFPPAGWAFCWGQQLAISENETLFILIGTTYGGDGETTFNLPNLSQRIPLHQGTGPGGSTYTLGEMGGVESVTLTNQQIPVHTHTMLATNDFAQSSGATNNVLARTQAFDAYNTDTSGIPTNMNPGSLAPSGGSQPHDNMPPFLCINFIISLFGLFPQQN